MQNQHTRKFISTRKTSRKYNKDLNHLAKVVCIKVHKPHQWYVLRKSLNGSLRMYLWWSLCTLYLHACQVSYCRWLRSLLSYLCNIFWALIHSLVCWSCHSRTKIFSVTTNCKYTHTHRTHPVTQKKPWINPAHTIDPFHLSRCFTVTTNQIHLQTSTPLHSDNQSQSTTTFYNSSKDKVAVGGNMLTLHAYCDLTSLNQFEYPET